MSDLPEFPLDVQLQGQNQGADPWYAEPQDELPGIGDVVLVASGKGGVGKSTVTVNLACTLQRQGLRVGIVDADLYGPSIVRMLGTDEALEYDDQGRVIPAVRHGIHAVSVANMLPPEAALVWKGPLVTQALMQMFHEVAWPELDLLLVDLPPGTGDVHLSILEQIPISGALLVTTPQKMALSDVERGIAMMHDLDIPVFGIIENMDGYICPCCGKQQGLFPKGGVASLASRKHVAYLGGLPLDPQGQQAADSGTPLVTSNPEGMLANRYTEISAQVIDAVEREQRFRKRDQETTARKDHQEFWVNLLEE